MNPNTNQLVKLDINTNLIPYSNSEEKNSQLNDNIDSKIVSLHQKKYSNGVYSEILINPTVFKQQLESNHLDNKDLTPYSMNNSKTMKDYAKSLKLKREKFGNPGSGNFKGPWASYKGEEIFKTQGELSEEQKEILSKLEMQRLNKLNESKPQEIDQEVKFEPTSIFHLKEDDNKEQSFFDPPSNLKSQNHACYIPKKLVHTYTGHTKNINKLKFFPKIGHFFLSCGADCKIKLWDVYNNRKCARTYLGHIENIKDISFSYDGLQFCSVGLDKIINVWDTETGKSILNFSNKKIPFCCVMNPDANNSNSFLVGTSQRSILQYDTRSAKITQTYEEHIGSINSLCFVDDNKKFISTSDDKKLYVWEFGIPTVIKHVSDPTMHSIVSTSLHPNGQYLAGQSLDNKILLFDSENNFKLNRKKKFTGHVTSGYSCGIDISPDGQFLASGDSNGSLWFWDWKTSKNYRVIEGHSKICSDIKWHPIEPSKVISCSWDGTIKLWD